VDKGAGVGVGVGVGGGGDWVGRLHAEHPVSFRIVLALLLAVALFSFLLFLLLLYRPIQAPGCGSRPATDRRIASPLPSSCSYFY
jgi:hypothetical protein